MLTLFRPVLDGKDIRKVGACLNIQATSICFFDCVYRYMQYIQTYIIIYIYTFGSGATIYQCITTDLGPRICMAGMRIYPHRCC